MAKSRKGYDLKRNILRDLKVDNNVNSYHLEYCKLLNHLAFAESLERYGAIEQAGFIYENSVSRAKDYFGPESTWAGLIIIEAVVFYERIGKDKKARELWLEIIPIASKIIQSF